MKKLLYLFTLLLVSLPVLAQVNISGAITLSGGSPVVGAQVQLVGGGLVQTVSTNAAGSYSFPGLEVEMEYLITPLADIYPAWSNPCITPADICLKRSHIEGTGMLDFGQLLQADLDQDGVVTEMDINLANAVMAGEAIFGVSVPEYIFDYRNPDNPDELSGQSEFNAVNAFGNFTLDFRALPVGDVNNACGPDQPPSPNQFGLRLESSTVQLLPGDAFCVDVIADEYVNLSNWQFGVTWNQNVSPVSGQVFPNGGLSGTVMYGQTTTGYNFSYSNPASPAVESLPAGDILVTFCFEATGMDGDNVEFILAGFGDNPDPLAAGDGCEDIRGTAGPDGTGSQLSIPIMDDMPEPITISCPEDLEVVVDANSCSSFFESIPVTIEPADGMYTITNTFNNGTDAGGFYPVGTTVVTYNVTDELGETETCSFSITVVDSEGPLVSCQDFGPVPIGGALPDVEDLITFLGDCNPQEVEVTLDLTELSCDDYDADAGGVLYLLTATNSSGNSSTCGGIVLTEDCEGTPSPDCVTDFDDEDISEWETVGGATFQLASPGPSGAATDFYLQTNDGSGGSWVFNTGEFESSAEEHEGECLCFDVRMFDVEGFTPQARFFFGNTLTFGGAEVSATFRAYGPITAEDGWTTFCVPILSCVDGELPSNEYGFWVTTGGPDSCAILANVLANHDGIGLPAEVPEFNGNIGYDNFCWEECELTEPATCDASVFSIADEECCPLLTFSNPNNAPIFALGFTLLDGMTFGQSAPTPAGHTALSTSPGTRVLAQNDLSQLPQNAAGFFGFCFSDITTPEQRVVVDYYADDLQTIRCSDTLSFFCPVPETCLEIASDTLLCAEEGEGYRLQVNVVVPVDGYTDDVGRVKFMVPGSDDPVIIDFTPALTAGQSFGIDTLLQLDNLMAGDTLKILVSAHDGPEERLCCFVDTLCLPIPDCSDPCDSLNVYAAPSAEDSCCYYLVVDARSLEPGAVDSIAFDTLEGFGFGVPLAAERWDSPNYSSAVNPTTGRIVYTRFFDADLTPVLDTLLYICHEPTGSEDSTYIKVETYLDDEIICLDTVAIYCPAVDPCDSLSAYVLPAEEECCYDVYLNNTYADDPALTAVSINLISGPSDEFSGRNLLPDAPGWNIVSEDDVNKSYTLTSSSGPLPQGLGQQVFQFCVAESFLSDSTYVEIGWVTETDTICRDTVAAICHDCMSVIEGEIGCDEDLNPTFAFTFTNYSDIPGNTIRILNTVGGTVIPGLPDTIVLGQMVNPGDTYSGTITVTFPGAVPGQEICFDAVLEQVLEGEAAIRCCYITHCFTPEPCDGFDGNDPVALSAFPNPTTGSVVLTSDHTGPAGISLLSPTGRQAQLQRVDFSGHPVPVELGDPPAGVYMILVRFDDGRQGIRRIVIE